MESRLITPNLLGEWYGRVSAARPLLRWAGGKSLFLSRYGNLFPPFEGRYFEPFLGSGAAFFHIQRRLGRPVDAVLGDLNAQLIRVYIDVRDEPERLAEQCGRVQSAFDQADNKADFYYEVRRRFNEQLPNPSSADFLFLNKTCWNGLYRVNKKGHFNVPYGKPKSSSVVPTREELLNVAAALIRTRLRATSWENSIAQAKPGDFVFLDPPYYSDIEKDDVKYRRRQFDLREHARLADRLEALARRGVSFLLTNSGEPEMIELYRDRGLTVDCFDMPRSISSKLDERATGVPELLVSPPGDPFSPALVHLQRSYAEAFER